MTFSSPRPEVIRVPPSNLRRVRVVGMLGLFAVIAGAISVWAQIPDVEIQPKVEFVSSPNAFGNWGLKWLGQKSTIDDELSEITLKNEGQERITGFQIGWVLFIPEGCGVREAGVPRSEVHLAPYHEETVLPGQAVTVGPFHLSSESIRSFARHAHSPAVVAQVGVVRTKFAGQTESIYSLEQQKIFTPEATSYPCQAFQKSAEAENALKTFFGSEFRFQYASLLIPCEKKEQGTRDGYYWVPDSCSAYFPVCDDLGGQGSETIACIAYPRKKFADAPAFEAAAFSVAAVEAASEKDCLARDPDSGAAPERNGKTVTINEVKFRLFDFGEGGMSQSAAGQVYLTFHRRKCYRLSVSMASVSSGAFDGDINEFSKEDADEVRSRLEQVRDSFTFVK